MTSTDFRLILISGRSGSGKSTVLNSLEDAGYNCIDNLPPALLPELINWMSSNPNSRKAAVCIDARNSTDSISTLPAILQNISSSVAVEVVFLDADDSILLQRFSATRRKHPLTDQSHSLAEAIESETKLLGPIASCCNLRIDTSALSVQDLRLQIKQQLIEKPTGLALQFMSFGFKHGLPKDTDLVFDVRCLPNPYWDKNLRQFTGKDQPIQAFLEKEASVNLMYQDIFNYMQRWLPEYEKNQRSYLTVAIGCTGGQHRSVYLAERLFAAFQTDYASIQIRHRDLGQDTD
ncbi:RNase adapter RapZ [Reinekea thalattae]|uniref:RNase adapter RapZ n=1 Tax=Reinekea thalattae TaxID=2593301 RepID=A0A5C8Z5I1_9GAMM|nr:RNase adapter RapZ [Reinekea thalattae]TXR52166.1 RNase adapter RapZ [Reinekea thalattae]